MALIPRQLGQRPCYSLPAVLSASFKHHNRKTPFRRTIRSRCPDAKTGFIFFNISDTSMTTTPGRNCLPSWRLAMSRDFATPGAAFRCRDSAGRNLFGAAMQPVEIKEFVNGELKG